MTLNDLLVKQAIDPARVIVMRHRPVELRLRRVLPWLVHERPEVFNAYQQKHHGRTEAALEKMAENGWVASFIALGAGQAVFCGLYEIRKANPVGYDQFRTMKVNQALFDFGMADWDDDAKRSQRLWFDLVRTPVHEEWIGKLTVDWPPPDRSWWRRAHKNNMAVRAITEESRFTKGMPDWMDLDLSWAELHAIPSSWKTALGHWRGIYFIHDGSDGRGYVGSAYGKENILGRWLNYAADGHGGNKLLLERDARNFRFSILQRVSPDMEPAEIIALESSWKTRLHTLGRFGLNAN